MAFYVDTLGLQSDEHRGEVETANVLALLEARRRRRVRAAHAQSRCASPTSRGARELEAKGVEFDGEIVDSGVCHMALLQGPDGNRLMLHRYGYAD